MTEGHRSIGPESCNKSRTVLVASEGGALGGMQGVTITCLRVNVVREGGMFDVQLEGDGNGSKENVEVELAIIVEVRVLR